MIDVILDGAFDGTSDDAIDDAIDVLRDEVLTEPQRSAFDYFIDSVQAVSA